MTAARRRRFPRPSLVMLPNGFTLANLFFGIFAIVAASRGQHMQAGWYIVIGAFCDMLDGRIARATNTGSAFGEELDSLVDAISFGLAPALMMYFAVLRHSGWDWVLVFLYSACAVMRLARFNIESAGKAKSYFKGLPSPAAGGTLATYYWFSQTPLYNETFIGAWPWETILRFLMAGLAFLMISNVPFPGWTKFTFKTVHGTAAIIVFVSSLFALFFLPQHYFFPMGIAYVLTGVVLAIVRGVLELPSPFDEPDELEENGDSLAEESLS
ncbi:MAG: CDP-diacylglycerol--serine O-phosphatidyltransferase [Gemmatimonadaceae bacterium]|nr:CDP-diacylglycerol--serine O-phosphatidyltransferase [Gemmatimonadaceae bacterium]